MSVRGAGRGKSGGVRGGKASGGASKAGGGGFAGKVEGSGRLVGPSGAVGSSEVGPTIGADPIATQALELIRQLKAGELASHDEATKLLVRDILQKKVRLQSKRVADRIAKMLQEDPIIGQTLERLWKRADDEGK